MKISLDLEAKSILVERESTLGALVALAKKLDKEGWEDFTIESIPSFGDFLSNENLQEDPLEGFRCLGTDFNSNNKA